jgi:hypothetical protein
MGHILYGRLNIGHILLQSLVGGLLCGFDGLSFRRRLFLRRARLATWQRRERQN